MEVQLKIQAHPGALSRIKTLISQHCSSTLDCPLHLAPFPSSNLKGSHPTTLTHLVLPTLFSVPCSSNGSRKVTFITFPWQLLFFQPPREPQHLSAMLAPPSESLPTHLSSLFLAQRRELTFCELPALAKHHAGPFRFPECKEMQNATVSLQLFSSLTIQPLLGSHLAPLLPILPGLSSCK